ncbi:unnamed protein product [Onchocerca flexuosa]|uniref:C2H2-type domain-containing protein n=1 Tax=Onchocerca flexuosa TaxID=387005 RepID=A0A183HC96_9BILA|nr:unnamed protein product [Onchocerca flexuosa]
MLTDVNIAGKTFTEILESEYWKLKYSLICKIESSCLRFFFVKILGRRRFTSFKDFMSTTNYSFHMPQKTAQTKIYRSICNQYEGNVARITRTDHYLVRTVPNKLFLCRQRNKVLCLNCEARFCVAKLVEFLEDVHKVRNL